MSVSDFTDTVACFMRVSWAAAAGKLHLAAVSLSSKDSSTPSYGSKSRQSSTGKIYLCLNKIEQHYLIQIFLL